MRFVLPLLLLCNIVAARPGNKQSAQQRDGFSAVSVNHQSSEPTQGDTEYGGYLLDLVHHLMDPKALKSLVEDYLEGRRSDSKKIRKKPARRFRDIMETLVKELQSFNDCPQRIVLELTNCITTMLAKYPARSARDPGARRAGSRWSGSRWPGAWGSEDQGHGNLGSNDHESDRVAYWVWTNKLGDDAREEMNRFPDLFTKIEAECPAIKNKLSEAWVVWDKSEL